MSKDPWNFGKLLDISGSYWQTCTLHAGVHLKVFSLIGDDDLTVENIKGTGKENIKGTGK